MDDLASRQDLEVLLRDFCARAFADDLLRPVRGSPVRCLPVAPSGTGR